MPDYLDDLRLAHVLADAADAATMERFKALDLKVETKPDMTPVSEADKPPRSSSAATSSAPARGTRSWARSTGWRGRGRGAG
ncbi:hypothetical protein GCM10023238_21060 [Streptomyces heliomycini]